MNLPNTTLWVRIFPQKLKSLQRNYRMGNLFLSWGFASHYPQTPGVLLIPYFTFGRSVFQPGRYLHLKREVYLIPNIILSLPNGGQTPQIWNPCSRGVFPSPCLLQGWTLTSGICFLQEFSRARPGGAGGHPGEEFGFGKAQAQLCTFLKGTIQNQGRKEAKVEVFEYYSPALPGCIF